MAGKKAIVSGVTTGSIAEEMGVRPGDRLVSINGRPVRDILDYRYLADEDCLEVELARTDGEIWTLEIEKSWEESLGLEFDAAVFDRIRPCVNKCLFCFVDQLPPGMRETLYVKDDDYRLSFLYGNFISLTNLSRGDWDKILGMRLSPLYVSVHATDPEVRARMLGSPKARHLMRDLRRLKDHNIEVHAQVVLCPGINDGECLERTVEDLASLWPSVQSVGIVPVGMTGFRADLPKLKPVTPEEAAGLIKKADLWQAGYRKDLRVGFVYLADEFYVKAGQDFPAPGYYDDYPQMENGIGLSADFLDRLREALDETGETSPGPGAHIICGYSAVPMFKTVASMLGRAGIELNIIPAPNNYFGGGVTVTGLLTGSDILQALGARFAGQRILLPDTILRDDGETLLDDMTVGELARLSRAEFQVIPPAPEALLTALLNGKSEETAGGE